MSDCHVETYVDADADGMHRAAVVHTATGRTVYVTWPYRSEKSAVYRAWRWLRDEYCAYPRVGLLKELAG